MPEPAAGQPLMPYPGLRVSVGDLKADSGTDAYKGVIILEGGVPSDYVISPSTNFQVQTQIRCAVGGFVFTLPAGLVTKFYIRLVDTNNDIPGSPFTGLPLAVMGTPSGDHGKDGPFDEVRWYSINSPNIPALPAGEYRILVKGTDASAKVFFLHDDTVILVA